MRLDRRDLLKMSAASVVAAFADGAGAVIGAAPARAASASNLSSYDAVGLAELIRSKQVAPAEAVEDAIRKIEAINPTLNAVIWKGYERARSRAARSVADAPFAGVPLLVKDNATIAGVPATRGSRALRGNLPDRTAPFFAALEAAGFILLGVTNMPELGIIDGVENVLYGPTRNPWNLAYSPGGSSGGSAACVAAGVVPLAHGTDGGGSLRFPASHCGLMGLKASRGRLLSGSFAKPAWPRLVDGALTRTVRDTALYLSVAEDPNTRLPKLGFVSRTAPTRLRIAVTYDGMLGQHPDPEVGAAIADTARLCAALGHAVEETKLPLDQVRLNDAAQRIGGAELARLVDTIAAAKGLSRLEDGFESRALGIREEALRRGPLDAQIAEALPVLQGATEALDRFFDGWDVLLTPVARAPVYEIGMRDQAKFSFAELEEILRDYAGYTSLHNICGTTAMSLPLHWDTRGLPLGSQFAARAGAEATLLGLAYQLEEARPWASKRPPNFVT